MTLTSWLILLASAGVHVVAHVALKRARRRLAFVWWMLVAGSVVFAPVAVWQWQPLSWAAAGVLVVSAVFETLYFFTIAQAYEHADLSIVYPLARGTSPLWLVVWSVLWLGEQITLGGVLGVGLIALGLYVINLPELGAWRAPLRALQQAGPRWALLAGLCISLYTALDRVGVRLFDPWLYTYVVLVVATIFLTPLVWKQVGWPELQAELRVSRWRWMAALIAGTTTLVAYGMVLYTLQLGTPASYAGAVREISVVLGVIIGIAWFKEAAGPMRVLGAVLVVAGAVIIKLIG